MATKRSKRAHQTREKLGEYRRKRDFRRTQEPSGDADGKRRGRALAFVIQMHDASHLHYDLRLELAGVMRSWAVPKGPSLDPADKRLAMQVEDHPLDYNTFEGTIPKGEYGGGTVMLWDRGTYRPDELQDGDDDEDAVRRGLKAGKLSFTLEGERLRGSFALVRTDREPRPKWLLIKHRDEDARTGSDITAEVMTSVDSGRTMQEIADERDRIWHSHRGGGEGGEEPGAADAGKGVDLAPMKPTPSRSLPDGEEWRYQTWFGGTRVLAYVTPEAARLVDERGRNATPKQRDVAEQLRRFARRVKHSFVLDGELHEDVLHLSDVLLLDDDVLLTAPYRERCRTLESLLHRRRITGVRMKALERDGGNALRSAGKAGTPGVIALHDDAPYTPGARSDGMLRITH